LILPDWRIPLSDLDYGDEEREAILRVLDTKWLSMGPEVAAYEGEFAKLIEVNHAIAVANGTAALHLASLSLGFGPGDEVIQPALNFVAAANMTVASGATPVFADIVGLAEPTIDPAHVESLITPRTKAVIVMHYGGYLCRMAELWAICRKRGLALIEDACHAVGAKYIDPLRRSPHGKMAGNVGDIAAFSTFSNKNIATGEGGMVVTNDGALSNKVRALRSHGMTTLTWDRYKGHASSYDVVMNGYNYRLDELHAALGRVQLAKLGQNNIRRRRLLEIYHQNLQQLPGWTVPFAGSGAETSGHLMVVVAPTTEIRCHVVEKLRERGVQTSLHYPCICDFMAFARWQIDDVNLSREFTSRVITLPLFPSLPASEVNLICQTIADCLH
jgi:dTDP-4-amino-4,6-dideoxygalactose transaminase